jgi:hypothetical protein
MARSQPDHRRALHTPSRHLQEKSTRSLWSRRSLPEPIPVLTLSDLGKFAQSGLANIESQRVPNAVIEGYQFVLGGIRNALKEAAEGLVNSKYDRDLRLCSASAVEITTVRARRDASGVGSEQQEGQG